MKGVTPAKHDPDWFPSLTRVPVELYSHQMLPPQNACWFNMVVTTLAIRFSQVTSYSLLLGAIEQRWCESPARQGQLSFQRPRSGSVLVDVRGLLWVVSAMLKGSLSPVIVNVVCTPAAVYAVFVVIVLDVFVI
jgi:hypothetical protein